METAEPQNTAKAALIVPQEIRPQLLKYSANPAKLRETTEPILGFEWCRRTISALRSGPISDVTHILRGSKAPQELIDRLRSISVTTFFGESLISPRVGNLERVDNALPPMENHRFRRLD